jgi:hypothetical protein
MVASITRIQTNSDFYFKETLIIIIIIIIINLIIIAADVILKPKYERRSENWLINKFA